MIFVAICISLAIMAFGIRDMFAFDRSIWAQTGRSRPAWVVLSIAFGPLAVLLYWGTVRFDLIDPSRLTEAS